MQASCSNNSRKGMHPYAVQGNTDDDAGFAKGSAHAEVRAGTIRTACDMDDQPLICQKHVLNQN
jgi:hypothetical protein